MTIALSDSYVFKKNEVRVLVFKEDGGGLKHLYTIQDEECSCEGFKHGKKCKHISMLQTKFSQDYIYPHEVLEVVSFLCGSEPSAKTPFDWQINQLILKKETPLETDVLLIVKVVLINNKKFVVYIKGD